MSYQSFASSVAILCVSVCCSAIADTQNYTGRQAFEIQRKSTCGSLLDEKVRFGIFEGRAYSRVPGEKDRHIFNVLGVNTRQCGLVSDAERGEGFRSVSREVMLYLHPETNEILDTWENPLDRGSRRSRPCRQRSRQHACAALRERRGRQTGVRIAPAVWRHRP